MEEQTFDVDYVVEISLDPSTMRYTVLIIGADNSKITKTINQQDIMSSDSSLEKIVDGYISELRKKEK